MTRTHLPAFLALLFAITGLAWGQQTPKPKGVSLEEVLSCANDPLILSILDLKGEDLGRLVPESKMADPKLMEFYGFWTVPLTAGKRGWMIMPKQQNNSFCRYYPTIDGFAVPKNGTTRYPINATVTAGELWSLDPNDVFAHANQFTFESGTFDNSTEVFLIAKKAETSIQFIFKEKKLKLYRVFYDSPKFN